MAGTKITKEAAGEPISLPEARTFCKAEEDEERQTLERLIAAARLHVERGTGHAFIRRTIESTFDEWPAAYAPVWPIVRAQSPKILLPDAVPLIKVWKVTYVDLDGATQELATTEYKVVTTRLPGRIRLAKDKVWPNTTDDEDVITVEYDVGYGEDDDVPSDAKVAMLFLIRHWYDNRGVIRDDAMLAKSIPDGYEALINGIRFPRFPEM